MGAIGIGGLALVAPTSAGSNACIDVLETSFLLLVVESGTVNRR